MIETEIVFNKAVTGTLQEVQRLCQQLEAGRAALGNGQITAAIEQLESTRGAIEKDPLFTNTYVMAILSEEVARLRHEIVEALRERWNDQLKIDRQKGEFQVSKAEGPDSLDNTIASFSRLGILASTIDTFQKYLVSAIMNPILLPSADGTTHGVAVEESGIYIDSKPSKASVSATLDRVVKVLGCLRQSLPPPISDPLSKSFIPGVSSKMISAWLSSAIPTDLDGLGDFEKTLDHVLQFTRTIESWGWSGQEELVSWVNQAPRLWLTRRRIDSLDSVRKVLAASQGTTKQVERIETEKVSQADEALLENATTDDWDAGWDDEKKGDTTQASDAQPEHDDEDVSAWGLDEEEEPTPDAAASTEEDDVDDSWGWNDEEDGDQKGDGDHPQSAVAKKPTNGEGTASDSPREVTLKEIYTVTDIPDSILKIVQQQIVDSKNISQPA